MGFSTEQRTDAIGNRAVTLQKWLIFFMICNIIIGVFGFPYSIFITVIRLAVLYCGFHGAFYKKTCCLMTYVVLKSIAIIFDIFGIVLAVIFVCIGAGIISYEAAEGEIYFDAESIEAIAVIGVVILFVAIVYTILYLGFNLYTIYLAFTLRSMIKANNHAYTKLPTPPPMKELNDFADKPEVPTPIEFQYVQSQPIYLQPVAV